MAFGLFSENRPATGRLGQYSLGGNRAVCEIAARDVLLRTATRVCSRCSDGVVEGDQVVMRRGCTGDLGSDGASAVFASR